MLNFDLSTEQGSKEFEEWQKEQIENGNAIVSEGIRDIYIKQNDGSVKIEKKMAKIITYKVPFNTTIQI